MKVVIITARGLHLGYLGCYGNEWIATPTLDRLAAEGIVCDAHFADCPDAPAARRVWRSGRYLLPSAPGEAAPSPEGSADLLALLQERGIGTALVLDRSRPSTDEFTAGWEETTLIPAPAGEDTALEATLDAAVQTLDRLAGRDQWLVWVDLATLLPPWDLPEPFRERYFEECEETADDESTEMEEADPQEGRLTPLRDPVSGVLEASDAMTFLRLQRSYAGAVTLLDAGLELLFEELRQRRLMDEIMMLFTTDHGYALGEHGIVGACRPWLHEELVHLPLVVRLPGSAESGRHLPTLTQAVDLMPTVLDAFGLPLPATQGHSLLPLLRGQREEVRTYACSGLQIGNEIEWSLRSRRWAFLLPLASSEAPNPRRPQLYVKPDDRWEVNNVWQHHLELAEHLEQTLRGFVQASRQPGPLVAPELREMEAAVTEPPESNQERNEP